MGYGRPWSSTGLQATLIKVASGLCAKTADLGSSRASPGDEEEAQTRSWDSGSVEDRQSKRCIVQGKGWKGEETQETRKRTLRT